MRAFIATLLAAAVYGKPKGGYNYLEGGEDWDIVYPDLANNICSLNSSREQSPIDLKDGTLESDLKITMTGYGKNPQAARGSDLMETNWEHVVAGSSWTDAKFKRTGGGDDKAEYWFTPLQFHFHTPSEHTVNGTSYQAEMHFVHFQAATGAYAVVGVFFDSSAGTDENLFLKNVFEGFGSREEANAEDKKDIDWSVLATSALDTEKVWMYDGSFTTPPCTEGVKWTVLQQVQSISPAQLAKFAQFTKGTAADVPAELAKTQLVYLTNVQKNIANRDDAAGNNRKIQPLNDRKLYTTIDSTDDDDTDGSGAVVETDTTDDVKDGASTLMATAAAVAAVSLLAF